MSGYVLAPTAQEDLTAIRNYCFEKADARFARQMLVEFVKAFRLIARTPGAGHRREDLAEDRPVLFWPVRDFLIIYKRDSSPVQIVTIARGTRDIPILISKRAM